jgi:hypothetical protein
MASGSISGLKHVVNGTTHICLYCFISRGLTLGCWSCVRRDQAHPLFGWGSFGWCLAPPVWLRRGRWSGPHHRVAVLGHRAGLGVGAGGGLRCARQVARQICGGRAAALRCASWVVVHRARRAPSASLWFLWSAVGIVLCLQQRALLLSAGVAACVLHRASDRQLCCCLSVDLVAAGCGAAACRSVGARKLPERH